MAQVNGGQPVDEWRRQMNAFPRILVTKAEAAELLGMSVDSFERYVQPYIRAIRKGRLIRFRVSDLERWAEENAGQALVERG
jgi:excisionase family DNA binding protein